MRLPVVGCRLKLGGVRSDNRQPTTDNWFWTCPHKMARGARLFTRRLWLVSGISAPVGWSLAVPRLLIRREGDSLLRISAPQIRFITGKSLERLKNANNVSFVSQISLSLDSASNVITRKLDRFVLSYDLWEEKFKATRLTPPVKSMERLTVPAAEAW